MTHETTPIHGQDSFLLTTRTVRAAITRFGAMLGPVTFRLDGTAAIEPYSIAPWATEALPADTHPLLRGLRGDFICSAFGDNTEPLNGRVIPAHGDTVNGDWHWVDERTDAQGTALRLSIPMRNQGGRCTATTILLDGHTFVYQRHDFDEVSGPINPGHHAMLRCPPTPRSARLSFSHYAFACAQPARPTLPASQLRSRLAPGVVAARLTEMACIDGSTADFSTFPAGEDIDDVLMVCAVPADALAWSAATFREQGYAWISLRNHAQLPSTLVWQSNGGMLQAPWSGRHRHVVALEDVMAYFAAGIGPSARFNRLNARGIPTSHWARPDTSLRIPYIQGVVPVPPEFERVASVEPCGPGRVRVADANRVGVEVACAWEFLASGRIAGLCED